MHEMSIVSGIMDCVERSAQQANAERVCAIRLSIGDMTEVVDEALNFAFEVLSEGTICEGARLEVEHIHPRSLCINCNQSFDHDRFHRACPYCGSYETSLLKGRELDITSIEIDIPDDQDLNDQDRPSTSDDKT